MVQNFDLGGSDPYTICFRELESGHHTGDSFNI